MCNYETHDIKQEHLNYTNLKIFIIQMKCKTRPSKETRKYTHKYPKGAENK